MKKLLMILIVIIINLSMVANEKELEIPDVKAPAWWYEIDDQTKWEYFRQMSIEYVRINQVVNEKTEISEELKKQLNDSNNFLKRYNPYYPKWGMDFNIMLLLDSSLTADAIININYRKYFFKGRVFISPGGSIKYSKELLTSTNMIGGGLSFGAGFTL